MFYCDTRSIKITGNCLSRLREWYIREEIHNYLYKKSTSLVERVSIDWTKKSAFWFIGQPSLKHLSDLNRYKFRTYSSLMLKNKVRNLTKKIHSNHRNFSTLNGLLSLLYFSRLPFEWRHPVMFMSQFLMRTNEISGSTKHKNHA